MATSRRERDINSQHERELTSRAYARSNGLYVTGLRTDGTMSYIQWLWLAVGGRNVCFKRPTLIIASKGFSRFPLFSLPAAARDVVKSVRAHILRVERQLG